MNALMKLTTVAVGALGIAGGVAMAQTSTDPKADSPTANVSITPNSYLKRDGNLVTAPQTTAPMSSTATTDVSTTTTTNSTSTTSPAATPASPAPASPTIASNTDAPLQPRSDRN